MLWKLSLTGIKSRFKDYLVLFSGLTFASAIFYMFMTLATNPAFLKGSLSIAFKITQIVFSFGIALLSIITFVYIVYANSFLLNLSMFSSILLFLGVIFLLNFFLLLNYIFHNIT